MEDSMLKEEILGATTELFNENGLKFTMDDLAGKLHRSKKTIYTVFPDKESLLNEMVDYVFDSIKETERALAEDKNSAVDEKLRRVLGAMPEQYRNVDFRKLSGLKERYPRIYAHLQRRLESGWELTVSLLWQGMNEGVFRRISIPVFKVMFEASLEQFFQRDFLTENGLTYTEALDEVVNIMMDGIRR